MAEQFINLNHGCDKSRFTSDEVVRVYIEPSDQILLHCHCAECKRTIVLDMSQEDDSKFRRLLRRMFVRQDVIETPDELFDLKRICSEDISDYTVQFHKDLERFPDTLVGHRELQDDWEELIITSGRTHSN